MRGGEMQLRIKDPVGSKVKLTITHEGAPAPIEVEVTRVALEQLKY
jgi:C-terminal processing protease CtpA/Prc